MKIIYNRQHLHISVGTATLMGMALGFWLGARAEDAGIFEHAIVLIGFVVTSHFVMALVDKRYLPRAAEFKE